MTAAIAILSRKNPIAKIIPINLKTTKAKIMAKITDKIFFINPLISIN